MCHGQAYHKHWNQHRAGHFQGFGHQGGRHSWKAQFAAALNTPPANVLEMDDRYELQLFAPGYEKSDFVIGLADDTLTISVEEKELPAGNWKRREYRPSGFTRRFALNDIINKETIEAKYEQGVLIVTLPKLEGFETSRTEINVG
ncbi:MAG: Hsp20/alpha crystallin family protein [Bacteroidia bacterium]